MLSQWGILTSADALLPWFTAPSPPFTWGQSESASNNLTTFQWQICFWFLLVITSCLCCTLDNQSSGSSDWSDQSSADTVIDYLIDYAIWLGVKSHSFCHISTTATKILYFIKWACLDVWLKQIITYCKPSFFCFTPFLNGVHYCGCRTDPQKYFRISDPRATGSYKSGWWTMIEQ